MTITSPLRTRFVLPAALAVLSLLGGLQAQDSSDSPPSRPESAPAESAPASLPANQRATVLLITSDELADAWQPFADWKTRQGKRTVIITTAKIAETYEGADIQQKIKACVLEHAAKKGTKWVVLGGDSQPGAGGHVPDRDSVHVLGRSLRYADIPSDVYYLSEKSWNANGDQYYGVWQHDNAEITYVNPHGACIGRIPMRTKEDVANYTAKVISYESEYPEADFAKEFISTCAVPQADYKTDLMWQRVSPAWDAGSLHKFFNNETAWDGETPGDYHLTPGNWAAKINARTAGKMHMHGHGFLPLWALEGRGQNVTAATVNTLRNKNAYLLMTTVSCFTGQYDAEKDPSITESMLRAKDAGAVAIVTPSREGVPIYPERFRGNPRSIQDGTTQLLTFYWKRGLGQNLTTGEAFAAARAEMTAIERSAGYHWCLTEINLLGDPTLDMRANNPTTPKVEVPTALSPTARSLTVKTDKPGATVCIWMGDAIYEVATAGDDGAATFRLPRERTGDELLVTVCGPSLNTWTGAIKVASGE